MSLVQQVLKDLEERRQKVENGGVNCIPSPFPAFTRDFPGVEQSKYYLVSGSAKSAKTQLTSLLFLYTPLLYSYYHPEQVSVHIIYFPLEETKEKITERFMCHLLYEMSGHKIRVSPMELRSVTDNKAIDKGILDILNTLEYQSILSFYEEHVQFEKDKNPTGCMKKVLAYAEQNGTFIKKWDERLKKEVFASYKPNNPNEYVIVIWDHAGLTSLEKSEGRLLNLKECIDKLSSYFVDFRDNLHYTPVLVQQQNMDTISLDAFKLKKIMPTLAGLADTKNSGKDCTLMIGITNPHAFELDDYRGYNTKRLGSYGRFVEVVLNREGESNGYLPLYFDGATNFFRPLPRFDDAAKLKEVYNLIDRNMGLVPK